MVLDVKRFHHIWLEIAPGQEDEARRFYSELFGATEIERPAPFSAQRGLWMDLCGVQIHFGTETNPELVALQDRGLNASERHFALVVSDAQAARRELVARGIVIKEGTPIAGMDRFSFRDPWNNKVELFSNVGSALS